MDTLLRTEGDVESKFIAPLFRDVLGYREQDLAWKRPLQLSLGREVKSLFADLVVSHKGTDVIAVEAKRPTEPVRSGLSQVDSYAFCLQTPYSVVTNGRQFVLRGYYSFNSRINVIDESVVDLEDDRYERLKSLISADNISSAFALKPNDVATPDPERIQDYRRFFRRLHGEIRDRDKLDPGAAFDELSKLLFLKAAEGERMREGHSRPVLLPEMIEEWEALGLGKADDLINQWFRSATGEFFPGVFGDHPRVRLSPSTLRAVLEDLRPFQIRNGDVDVKGRAFEEFLPTQLRGKGLGQFFTPRPIVDFMVALSALSIQDVVVDFSCGSGGFLIKAFEQMKRYADELPTGTLQRLGVQRAELIEDIKAHHIFGIDAEPRAARTAKMNMLMWGDGDQVVRGNALDIADFSGVPYKPAEYDPATPGSGCSLILANPPFGSKEKDKRILARYDLGGKQREVSSERTEVLFIEKGLRLLRPEGKMLIVLPQGLLSSSSNDRVRDYIHSKAEIRAIVGLPSHTFVQSGVPTVNTCILYVQKFTDEKQRLYEERTKGLGQESIRTLIRTDPEFDYDIFFGTAEFIGYEPSGRTIGANGEKTDLDLLLDDFSNMGMMEESTVDVFAYAMKYHAERSHRRKDQTVRGTTRGLKTAMALPLSETRERLDPPHYFFQQQAGPLLSSLRPLGGTIKERKGRFRPTSDAELDQEYLVLSVSSDGLVTLNERMRGEEFKQMKRVRTNDIVYNPMRLNIGSIGVVPAELDGGLVSPDYVVFRSTWLDPAFLVMLLRSPFYRMYIDVVSTGSIRDRLYFRDLCNIRVPEPSSALQSMLRNADDRADNHRSEALAAIAEERKDVTERIHDLVRSAAADREEVAEAFASLASQLRLEAGMLSSPRRRQAHPTYERIVALGPAVVPDLLREIAAGKTIWFDAIERITGVAPPSGTSLSELPEFWREWAAHEGITP